MPEINSQRVLQLVVKKKWFDLIASGKKREEYREIKTYWFERLVFDYRKVWSFFCEKVDYTTCKNANEIILNICKQQPSMIAFKNYDIVCFRDGYSKTPRKAMFYFNGISISEGHEHLGAKPGNIYFKISLGDCVE